MGSKATTPNVLIMWITDFAFVAQICLQTFAREARPLSLPIRSSHRYVRHSFLSISLKYALNPD